MSCLAVRNFYSHNKILLSRVENNLLIDHSKFLKIFCDLYMYCSEFSSAISNLEQMFQIVVFLPNLYRTTASCFLLDFVFFVKYL